MKAKKYYCKDKSRIAEKISNYKVSLITINHFIEKNDFKVIILLSFQKLSLDIKSLVKCFKETLTRNNVRIIYKNICQIIIEKLQEIK